MDIEANSKFLFQRQFKIVFSPKCILLTSEQGVTYVYKGAVRRNAEHSKHSYKILAVLQVKKQFLC